MGTTARVWMQEESDVADLFICYRRRDSQSMTRHIHDALTTRFGKESVFWDIGDIPPGVDYVEYIEKQLSECSVLLAVIGQRWLTFFPRTDRNRPNEEVDFVQLEITKAIQLQKDVLPVLVDGATMPSASQMPTGLEKLATLNGLEVRSGRDFDRDMTELVEHLAERVGAASDWTLGARLRAPISQAWGLLRSAALEVVAHRWLLAGLALTAGVVLGIVLGRTVTIVGDQGEPTRPAAAELALQPDDLLQRFEDGQVQFAGIEVLPCVLQGAVLPGVVLTRSQLYNCNLSATDLSDAQLGDAVLAYSDFTDAILSGADLSGADARFAKLYRADLTGSNLRGADLRGASFPYAVLDNVSLARADLRGASLVNIHVNPGASIDFEGADLSGANLEGVNLAQARNLSQYQLFATASYRDALLPGGLQPDWRGVAASAEAEDTDADS